jgi:hypothetical protein
LCTSARSSRYFRGLAVAIAVTIIVALSFVAARRTVDFPVYHYAARSMLSHGGPIYGPQSGIGWPQVYRYPPLFLLLFIPFALLPLRVAAVVWAALKFVVLAVLARELFVRLRISAGAWPFLVLLPALPYLALEFHYGNVQFFVFALVAGALLWLERRPKLAAFALALGISIKVAPLFFMPYLVARRRIRVAVLALLLTLALTLLPAAYFGWRANFSLLRQWAGQELAVASTAGEPAIVGFPSQSLHSVLMRYFVSLDYSKLTDSNYPKVNIGSFDPRAMELLWFLLAAAGYSGLLVFAQRFSSDELLMDAIAFCALLIIQPFSQMGDLVILVWPIAVAAALLRDHAELPAWVRAAVYAAFSIMVLKPLLPDRNVQRLLQVVGMDFAATALLAASLIGKCVSKPRGSAVPTAVETASIFSLPRASDGRSA